MCVFTVSNILTDLKTHLNGYLLLTETKFVLKILLRITKYFFYLLLIAELDKLNLAENQISEVGAGALKRLTGLVSLDLTRNNIDFIHPDAFREISG